MNRVEPPSWLQLERYALGELSGPEPARVERALEQDPDTRTCFETISEPIPLRPLVTREAPRIPSLVTRWKRRAWVLAPLAAAAALLLLVTRSGEDVGDFPGARTRVKGGDIAISLVRERDGRIDESPTTFAPADRFEVVLTCPPGLEGTWDVVAFQGSERFFPLDPANITECGNRRPVEGAFAIDGEAPVRLCLVRRAPGGDHDAREAPEALGEEAVCATLARHRE